MSRYTAQGTGMIMTPPLLVVCAVLKRNGDGIFSYSFLYFFHFEFCNVIASSRLMGERMGERVPFLVYIPIKGSPTFTPFNLCSAQQRV